ncbi:hypothetical protein CLV48_104139 [Cecembia rubra]|uniref:Uncharacterized protein n=1 Tax=Cecembia rubra TaxID=1485585 RepID=A0A2P8E670_9BACT|nr:hypothetical protein CLV48_104139 [Cecembia rubra]
MDLAGWMMKKKAILFFILVVSLIISIAIFKDWGNFKRGLKVSH